MSSAKRNLAPAIGLLFAVVAAGVALRAWRTARTPEPRPALAVAAPAGRAAQRVAIDPATGRVLEQDDSAPAGADPIAVPGGPRALQALRGNADTADEVHLPDGTVGVRVAQQYYHTIRVCRQPDGQFSSDCPDPPPGRDRDRDRAHAERR